MVTRALNGVVTSDISQPSKVTLGQWLRLQASSSWHKASLVAVPSQPFSGLGHLPSLSCGGRSDAAFQGAFRGQSTRGTWSPEAGMRSLMPGCIMASGLLSRVRSDGAPRLSPATATV